MQIVASNKERLISLFVICRTTECGLFEVDAMQAMSGPPSGEARDPRPEARRSRVAGARTDTHGGSNRGNAVAGVEAYQKHRHHNFRTVV